MSTYDSGQELICPASPTFRPLKLTIKPDKFWRLPGAPILENISSCSQEAQKRVGTKSSIMLFLSQKQRISDSKGETQ